MSKNYKEDNDYYEFMEGEEFDEAFEEFDSEQKENRYKGYKEKVENDKRLLKSIYNKEDITDKDACGLINYIGELLKSKSLEELTLEDYQSNKDKINSKIKVILNKKEIKGKNKIINNIGLLENRVYDNPELFFYLGDALKEDTEILDAAIKGMKEKYNESVELESADENPETKYFLEEVPISSNTIDILNENYNLEDLCIYDKVIREITDSSTKMEMPWIKIKDYSSALKIAQKIMDDMIGVDESSAYGAYGEFLSDELLNDKKFILDLELLKLKGKSPDSPFLLEIGDEISRNSKFLSEIVNPFNVRYITLWVNNPNKELADKAEECLKEAVSMGIYDSDINFLIYEFEGKFNIPEERYEEFEKYKKQEKSYTDEEVEERRLQCIKELEEYKKRITKENELKEKMQKSDELDTTLEKVEQLENIQDSKITANNLDEDDSGEQK